MTLQPHERIYQKIKEIFSPDKVKEQNLIVEIKNSRMNIRMNRPKRYNALTIDMYLRIADLINSAATMDDVKYIVISGEGGNFSSGNDLTNFSHPLVTELGEFRDVIKASSLLLSNFVQAVIKSKKPLFAITEGKVIGVCFTQLPLFDKVFASQDSRFVAPLVSSAQGPEMSASYTFPKIFGMQVAEELVSLATIVKPEFLQKYNVVETCKNRKDAEEKLAKHLERIDELEWQSFINARRLYREREEKILLEVNEREIQNLIERWNNPELMTHLANHMQRMKKAKL